jgi:hypothetical protein
VIQPAGIDQHHPMVKVLKIVVDLEIVEDIVGGQHLLQQLAKRRDIPLAIPQVVDFSPDSLLGSNPEKLIEGVIGTVYGQIRFEHQQWFMDCLHDTLSINLSAAEFILNLISFCVHYLRLPGKLFSLSLSLRRSIFSFRSRSTSACRACIRSRGASFFIFSLFAGGLIHSSSL